ncbi:ribose-phosphate pyrophosphokinase [Priestia megaterium]|uniref:ribose-phosphate pyrophosphokinase n=1 Tax=Priestia megaterium TaxID=1404 RepID=UPI00352AD582
MNTVEFKFESDEDLLKLQFVKRYIDSLRTTVSRVELVIYYMPYSRMDRSEGGSPFTLKYVTEFINSLDFEKITVIEPHSDVTMALLDRAEPLYVTFDLLPTVMKEVGFDESVDYVVFPDAGASKRYSKIGDFCTLVGHKDRDFATGKIQGLELIGINNRAGEKAVIVDDLSSYGGTFVATSKELRKMGVKEVYLLVAHAENSVFKGELFDHIDRLFTTDSIMSEQNKWENRKFDSKLKVYEVSNLIH